MIIETTAQKRLATASEHQRNYHTYEELYDTIDPSYCAAKSNTEEGKAILLE